MIIYIEGVDGSGKSTLALALFHRIKELENIKNVKVVMDEVIPKCTLPGADRFTANQVLNKMHEMVTDINTVYICDRGPLSDIVYRTFDTQDPVVNLDTLIGFWLAYRHLFTVVACDSNVSEKLMLERGDTNPIAYSKHKEIRYLYQQYFPLFGAVYYDVGIYRGVINMIVNNILARVWTEADKWTQLQELKERQKNERVTPRMD